MKLSKKYIFPKGLLICCQNITKTKKLTLNKAIKKLKIKSKMSNDSQTVNLKAILKTKELLFL